MLFLSSAFFSSKFIQNDDEVLAQHGEAHVTGEYHGPITLGADRSHDCSEICVVGESLLTLSERRLRDTDVSKLNDLSKSGNSMNV